MSDRCQSCVEKGRYGIYPINCNQSINKICFIADEKIKKLQSELSTIQKKIVKAHSMKIGLCLFGSSIEEIFDDQIELQNSSIAYKGKLRLRFCNLRYTNNASVFFLKCLASDGSVQRFYFDAIYKNSCSDSKYMDLVSYLESCLNGRSLCILTHGVTGKSQCKIYNYSVEEFSQYVSLQEVENRARCLDMVKMWEFCADVRHF